MGASGSYWQTNWQPMGAWPKVVSVFDCRRKLNMADFDIWIESWKRGSTRWHEGQVNAMLEKHAQDLTSGRTNLRVFVPMCGKSVDLLWLTDNGHTVVGVELAEIAVKSFFEENQGEFATEAINLAPNGANIFRAKKKAPTIFNCDIFCLSSEVLGGKFDAIYLGSRCFGCS